MKLVTISIRRGIKERQEIQIENRVKKEIKKVKMKMLQQKILSLK
jgi:hypothetical protein